MFLDILKKTHLVALVLTFFLTVGHNAYAGTVIDQVGRKVVVPDNPQRVIALAPSITEIIYDLGEEKRLQGVTRYSDHPARAKALPKVGTYVHLDLERIVALKPDLCISTKDGNPKHVIEKIAGLGIPVYVINPRSLEQTMDTIARIGSLLNAELCSHWFKRSITDPEFSSRLMLNLLSQQVTILLSMNLSNWPEASTLQPERTLIPDTPGKIF
jgi:ABC-type Fe3+-hydroxamate transport system substrate-binding protein